MEILFILLTIFGLTLSQPPPPPRVSCEGVNNLDYLPSPIDCSKFYQCIEGDPFLLSCPRGLYFSVEARRCTSPEEANCVITPPPPPGPPSISCVGVPNFRFVASPLSCSNYYQCVDGNAFLLSCPLNQHFDEERQTCDDEDKVDCVLTPPTTPTRPPPTPPGPPTVSCEGVPNLRFISSPFSCYNFYQCVDGDAFLLACPIYQHFDEERQICDDKDVVNCVLTSPGPSPPPTPTSPSPPSTTPRPPPPSCEGVPNFRLIPSPRSCYSYFQCINGTPFELKCPRGLYFNERIQTCDYPGNVDCVTSFPSQELTTSMAVTGICESEDDFTLLPHPESCALFYQCFNGIDFLVSCPVGRYFDENARECRESAAVECGERTRRPTTTTRAPIIDPQCRGVEEGRFVANVNSCFYQCLDGRANPKFCDDGLWFDESLQACDLPENVNCPAQPTTTTPRTTFPTFPTVPTTDPENVCEGLDDVYIGSRTFCEVYYFCSNGIPVSGTCRTGYHFDRELQECRPQDEVNCDLRTLAPTTEIPTTTPDNSPVAQCRNARNNTFIRNPMSCGEFFMCVDDEDPQPRTCQNNFWFNYIQQRCTPSYQAICELDPVVCQGVPDEDTIRSPTSCTDFITCINNRPFPGQCFNNLFFDEETQRCDVPENVECELANTTTQPPPSDNPCWGVPDFYLAASLENCAEYFVCYNNEKIASLECPGDQNFDVATQVCGDFECSLRK